MIPKAVIIHYGGSWVGDAYVGGERRYLPVQSIGISRFSLLDQIEVMVGADRNSFNYFLSSSIEASEGTIRMDVTDDFEFKFVMENCEVPKFYVMVSPIMSNPVVGRTNFMALLNAQEVSRYAHNMHDCNVDQDHDDEVVDDDNTDVDSLDDDDDDYNDVGGHARLRNRHFVPPLGDSSTDVQFIDETLRIARSSSRQWVIPGALYQASLPMDDIEHGEQYDRDTLSRNATFKDKESMLISLGLYHLHNRVEFAVKRSSKTRFTAVCKHHDRCPFTMRATSCGPVWRVIMWTVPHTCHSDFRAHGPRTVSSRVVGAFFAPTLMVDGAVLKPKEMAARLRREYGFHVDYPVALAGRNHAISMIYGDSSKSFQLLPSYLYMIQQCNPGSVVDLETDGENRFKYAYMSLSASIKGFLSSGRPVIVVDGTHLKGKYRGIMFVAATMDGNEQLFPLAVGLGDKESDESWIWFFKQLRKTFGCPENLLLVSDQHISIKNAIAAVYPGVSHGICIYHLQKKLVGFGEYAVDMFIKAAYCYSNRDFEKYMSKLALLPKNGAYHKLMDLQPCRWARSQCEVRRYTFLTSNCAESVNGRLRWARRLPVCTLFECVRTLIGHWFQERRSKALASANELTARVTKKLEHAIEEGLTMDVETINAFKFRVRNGDKSYIVDLNARTCSCREFDLNLIPCPHACASIWRSKQSCASYVSSYYTMEALREIYACDVNPIPHTDDWFVPMEIKKQIVGVPNDPKQAGRPKMSRVPSGGESSSRKKRKRSGGKSSSQTKRTSGGESSATAPSSSSSRARICSRCNEVGHYRSTCEAHVPVVQLKEPEEAVATRRPKRCSLCHLEGHTKRKCILYRNDGV